jgi:hypothetical protein
MIPDKILKNLNLNNAQRPTHNINHSWVARLRRSDAFNQIQMYPDKNGTSKTATVHIANVGTITQSKLVSLFVI